MHSFSRGLIAAVPIASGYVPVAITFGLVTRSFGLTAIDAVLASLIVFAGAAQFLAIGMYGSGVAAGLLGGAVVGGGGVVAGGGLGAGGVFLILQIVIAGWLLNLRHLLMSSVIARNIGPLGPGARSALAFGVTDEVFGVAGWRIADGGTVAPRYLAGLEIGAYSAWVGGTLIGAVSGEILPANLRIAMGLALYALFAALLAGQIRAAARTGAVAVIPVVVAAAAAATINGSLRMGLHWDAGAAFPVAMVGGTLIAMVLEGRRDPR